jgi:hypothetical protein
MREKNQKAQDPEGDWREAHWKAILSHYQVPEPREDFVERVLMEKKFQDLLQERKVPSPSSDFVQNTFAKVLKDRESQAQEPQRGQKKPQHAASLLHPRVFILAAAIAAILVLTLILRGPGFSNSSLIPRGDPMEVAEQLIQPANFPKFGSNPFSRALASRTASILPPPPSFVDFEDR